ncbi:MAG TPA: ABC transporter ATP-binding protein [Candidatus Scatomonas merdigallinarum]|nr:ABC transporter ATP-binding protein [Candidatus Scatomonas merdigallinarum]
MAYIEAKGIHKTFGKGEGAVHALRGASLSADKGEMVAVMGKSGSGKSTLLNIIGGLMTMDDGELYIGGEKVDFRKKKYLLNYRRKEVGFVVQYFALIEDMNIYKNVSLPLKYQGMKGRKIRGKTMKMLKKLGIADKARSYPSELSGGQQQRAAIARALVKDPAIILADEPTGALDEETGKEVMRLLQELKMKDRVILIVTHDDKVAEYCDRTIYLRDGVQV